ncbi:MAG: hypothetical protein Q4F29_01605 [Lachnospiraceae bacterium]|nr:hypothetical protein [Lachnospiraceae bacterium]
MGNKQIRKPDTGDRVRYWGMITAGAVCLAVGWNTLFVQGSLKRIFDMEQGRGMILETAVFFLFMLAVGLLPLKRWVKIGGISLGMLAGIWCHQVFLPFVVSGLWFLGILTLGDWVRQLAENHGTGKRKERKKSREEGKKNWLRIVNADFLIGSGAWISLVCILSAFHIGGLRRMRLLAAALTAMVFLVHLLPETARHLHSRLGQAEGKAGSQVENQADSWLENQADFRTQKEDGWDFWNAFFLAVLLTMVFVQLARINLRPDYDSLHYGLRSPYILDIGHGIYENLGNINLVYTYPKGFEILAFPLAGTATFAYQLCLNLWLAVFVLLLIWGLVMQLGGSRRLGLFAAASVSLVPGIMNMAITAKSDMATLVCQLGILCAAAGILNSQSRKEKGQWFGIAAGGCFLSYSMKPTSMVFSTVLSVACLIDLIGKGGFSRKGTGKAKEGTVPEHAKMAGHVKAEKQAEAAGQEKSGAAAMAQQAGAFRQCAVVLLPALGAWLGTWVRTYRLIGVPTTSVFTSIWELLGFQVRWPYAFASIPDQGMEMSLLDGIRFLAKRLYGVFVSPAGEDMLHVIIAWGTSSMVIFLLAWMFWGRRSRADSAARSCMHTAAVVIGLVSLVSIYLLWQVDGNYFMLMYVLLVVNGVFALEERKAYRGNLPASRLQRTAYLPRLAGYLLFAAFFLFQAMVTMATNWSGTVGFTPVRLKNPGYMNHQQAVYEAKCRSGNQAIWSILSSDPEVRVLAFGAHPEVLWLPGSVQSYYDVTGSGGNVRLVKTLDDFKAFLKFAGTDYIYVQAGYLERGTRAYDVARYLVEDGSLADIRYENGNVLGRVNLDGAIETEPEKQAAEYYKMARFRKSGGEAQTHGEPGAGQNGEVQTSGEPGAGQSAEVQTHEGNSTEPMP